MESHGFDFIFSHSYKGNNAKILAFWAKYYRHFVRLSDFVYLSSVSFRDLLGIFVAALWNGVNIAWLYLSGFLIFGIKKKLKNVAIAGAQQKKILMVEYVTSSVYVIEPFVFCECCKISESESQPDGVT